MKPTLLVLAAGLGARYGGLKQIEAVGPHGQTIIDYSIYDGIRAGFGKVVFVIRHYFEDAFKKKVSSKFNGFVETVYAYQEMDACLGDFELPRDREKPWGTGHAILVSQDVIRGPFAVINADDYYGTNAFTAMAEFLTPKGVASEDYAMIGYTLRNTLSAYGAVSRGVSECDEHMVLKRIVERTEIRNTGNTVQYFDADGTAHPLTGDEIVSMNLWGFQPSVFLLLQSQFARFLNDRGGETDSEFFIPSAVDALMASGKVTVRVLPTTDSWFGITYRRDRSIAVRRIRRLTNQGTYPEKLWG